MASQGGIKPDAFAEAIQRARQIAAKLGVDPGTAVNPNPPGVSSLGLGALKRPLEDGDQPESKKLASQNDIVSAQLAAIAFQHRPQMSIEYKVPDKMVGFIIGRGGENISRIQSDSGCKVQFAPDSGGQADRPCTLTGTPEAIAEAKRMLDQIVERGRIPPGPAGVDHTSHSQEMMIPADKVGLIIGKGGETIKQLQDRAGVRMLLIQDGSQPTGADKPLRIMGEPFKVQQAKELVLELLREKDREDFRPGNNNNNNGFGNKLDVTVPRFAVGIVIGRSGEMIKKIQSDAGVRIQFKPDDGSGPERVAVLVGSPDCCQHASQ
uniref:K Homology domain-containing protein n=1 Tax=Petromyzon marinus TaxID=7757 RepID=S4RV89_PETMA